MPTTVRLNERGLVPAIAQDARTGQVLMLAFMDQEALRRTLETGEAWFYSRSREELWHKGATSGHYLNVVEVRPDCDGDAILLRVEPTGPACHTGNDSCFYQAFDQVGWEAERRGTLTSAIEGLAATIAERRREMPQGSYTADLLRSGVLRIAQKVIEEAGETALAGVASAPAHVRAEAADLLYHLLVLLEVAGVSLEEVGQELEQRRR